MHLSIKAKSRFATCFPDFRGGSLSFQFPGYPESPSSGLAKTQDQARVIPWLEWMSPVFMSPTVSPYAGDVKPSYAVFLQRSEEAADAVSRRVQEVPHVMHDMTGTLRCLDDPPDDEGNREPAQGYLEVHLRPPTRTR